MRRGGGGGMAGADGARSPMACVRFANSRRRAILRFEQHARCSGILAAMGAGASTSGSAMFAGEGGCFSVKIRGGPLSVHDRAVLRVTPDYLRLLRFLGNHEAIYSKEDEANPRNVLLHLDLEQIKSFALAGRFFSVTAPFEGSDVVRAHSALLLWQHFSAALAALASALGSLLAASGRELGVAFPFSASLALLCVVSRSVVPHCFWKAAELAVPPFCGSARSRRRRALALAAVLFCALPRPLSTFARPALLLSRRGADAVRRRRSAGRAGGESRPHCPAAVGAYCPALQRRGRRTPHGPAPLFPKAVLPTQPPRKSSQPLSHPPPLPPQNRPTPSSSLPARTWSTSPPS